MGRPPPRCGLATCGARPASCSVTPRRALTRRRSRSITPATSTTTRPITRSTRTTSMPVPMAPPGGAAGAARTSSAPTSWRRSSRQTGSASTRRRHGRLVERSEIPHEALGGRRDGRCAARRRRRAAPAFFFHLGDVIYNFGEADYYYDQFYEPFRAYDRPIFAIPGNHDGAVTYTQRRPRSRTCRPFRPSSRTSAPRRPASPRTRAGWRARR